MKNKPEQQVAASSDNDNQTLIDAVTRQAEQFGQILAKSILNRTASDPEAVENDKSALAGTLISTILSTLLKAEMDAHLGYSKYQHTKPESGAEVDAHDQDSQDEYPDKQEAGGNSSPSPTSSESLADDSEEKRQKRNYRNGSYKRNVKTSKGKLSVDFPRDRNGTFNSIVLPKGKNSIFDIEDKILSMAALGNSTREIANIVQTFTDVEVSHEYVHNVVENYKDRVSEWKNTSLEGRLFPFIFLDCTYIPVRTASGRSAKRPLYVVLGIDSTGHKELIDFEIIGETETLTGWQTILMNLHDKRKLKHMMFVCSDGVVGLNKVIKGIYPDAIHQRCIVHLVRNSVEFVTSKQLSAWCKDFRAVYSAPDLAAAEEALSALSEKWRDKAPLAVNFVKTRFEACIQQLFSYPPAIRQVVYTTNAIESVNSSLKEVINKGCFKDAGSVMSVLHLRYEKVLKKRWSRTVHNWPLILSDLLKYEKTKVLMSKHAGVATL